jgi:penicillin-binding protein 1A
MDVQKTTDPITKKDVYIAPDGYDATADDDVHKCDDAKPSIGSITVTHESGSTYTINVSVASGTNPLQQLEIKVGDTIVATPQITSAGTYSAPYTFTSTQAQTITATVTDSVYYSAVATQQFTPS